MYKKKLVQAKLFQDDVKIYTWDLTELQSKSIDEMHTMLKEMNDMRNRMFKKDDLGAVRAIDGLKEILYKEFSDRNELPF